MHLYKNVLLRFIQFFKEPIKVICTLHQDPYNGQYSSLFTITVKEVQTHAQLNLTKVNNPGPKIVCVGTQSV